MASFVLPPASALSASPLLVQRRVGQRADVGDVGPMHPSAAHIASSRAGAQMPSVAPMRAAAPAPAAARSSMGLFAHMPSSFGANSHAAAASSSHTSSPPPLASLASEERLADPHSRLGGLGLDLRAAAQAGAGPNELARIYAFMDEAQERTKQAEKQVEEQKEANRTLLISSSQELIALQSTLDSLQHEQDLLAHELASLAGENRIMLTRAQQQQGQQGQQHQLQQQMSQTQLSAQAARGNSSGAMLSSSISAETDSFDGMQLQPQRDARSTTSQSDAFSDRHAPAAPLTSLR